MTYELSSATTTNNNTNSIILFIRTQNVVSDFVVAGKSVPFYTIRSIVSRPQRIHSGWAANMDLLRAGVEPPNN